MATVWSRRTEPSRGLAPRWLVLLGVVALGGCALKSDVTRVQQQLTLLEGEMARQDSARAAQLAEVVALQQRILDSLAAGQQALANLKGSLDGDLYNIQQQLVQVQALTGQGQVRLSELRSQLEARNQQRALEDGAAPSDAAGPSDVQIYEASLAQLRRGSMSTARAGFQELLRQHPTSPRVVDALYFIGETFATEAPDSAAAYYQRVVRDYGSSPRAPGAQYKLGLLAEQRGNRGAAREAYTRVIRQYPNSDEAALARDRLSALGQ